MKASLGRLALVVLSAFIAVAALGSEVRAGTVTVWPDQFIMISEGAVPTVMEPDFLEGNGNYYAPVKLPVDAKVKHLMVTYTKPVADPPAFYAFHVSLRRRSPTTTHQDIISFDRKNAELLEGTFTVKSEALDVNGPLRIASGYRYYIQYEPSGIDGGRLHSVQIVY